MAKPRPVGGIEVLLRDSTRPEDLDDEYIGCEEHTEFIKAGWRKSPTVEHLMQIPSGKLTAKCPCAMGLGYESMYSDQWILTL